VPSSRFEGDSTGVGVASGGDGLADGVAFDELAEYAGEASPDGMQHLLARAVWDEDAVRDDVRA
jgi:hypothetical protein